MLPIHFKQLVDTLGYIDESMNFIKRCRRTNEIGNITFAEVKTSIAKTYGRTINLSHFRQLLTVVPEFYTHSWDKVKGQKNYQVTIDFCDGSNSTKNLDFFEKRKTILREKLTKICVREYKEVMDRTEVAKESKAQAELVNNPLKYQQWHHSFDPHTQIQ